MDEELCDHEVFEGRCATGEIIDILSAEYGHIEVGKCIETDTGFLGCKADVFGIMQQRCTGKQSCQLRVDSQELRTTKPCIQGITLYLKVAYICVKGIVRKIN